MSSDRLTIAKSNRISAGKIAVENLIAAIDRDFTSEGLDHEKIKAIVDGRVSSIDTARVILVGLIDNTNPEIVSYVKSQINALTEASWTAYNILMLMLAEEIPSDFNDYRLSAISDGKRKAFEQSEIILESIRQLQDAIQENLVSLTKEVSASGHLERRAKSMGFGVQKSRETRNR